MHPSKTEISLADDISGEPSPARSAGCSPISSCWPMGTASWNMRHSSSMGVSRLPGDDFWSMTNCLTAAKRAVEVTSGIRAQSIAESRRERSRSTFVLSRAGLEVVSEREVRYHLLDPLVGDVDAAAVGPGRHQERRQSASRFLMGM